MNRKGSTMKKMIACATLLAVAVAAPAACFDYTPAAADRSDGSTETWPTSPSDAGAPPPSFSSSSSSSDAQDAVATLPDVSSPPPDAGNPCDKLSYRGATPSVVVCPGTTTCGCGGGDVCCMPTVDALGGACTSLGTCRTIALQCDGPEDCDGGVCCLQNRTGGGSSCRSGSSCSDGQWLCRSDDDCASAPAGAHCTPLDLGVAGVDDVGLDGIIGTCGK
jgi:hypothetical protein